MLQGLELHLLEDRRRRLRLIMLYNIPEVKLPDIPTENCLTSVKNDRRRIRPTRFEAGCETKNPLMKLVVNNIRGFALPVSRTEQYGSSFFVRTAATE